MPLEAEILDGVVAGLSPELVISEGEDGEDPGEASLVLNFGHEVDGVEGFLVAIGPVVGVGRIDRLDGRSAELVAAEEQLSPVGLLIILPDEGLNNKVSFFFTVLDCHP